MGRIIYALRSYLTEIKYGPYEGARNSYSAIHISCSYKLELSHAFDFVNTVADNDSDNESDDHIHQVLIET